VESCHILDIFDKLDSGKPQSYYKAVINHLWLFIVCYLLEINFDFVCLFYFNTSFENLKVTYEILLARGYGLTRQPYSWKRLSSIEPNL